MTKSPPAAAAPTSFGKRRDPSSPASDLRAATRATLMIRSGKLICGSGEYLCLIRDVSAGGVRLRLFHALPRDAPFFLESGNGAKFAMVNRWCNGDQAGFQFDEPIDVEAFIAEASEYPRRPIRLNLESHGQLVSQGQRAPMVLRNISQDGARIETAAWLALHETVKLAVDGLAECYAEVRWRNRTDHGLAFTQHYSLDKLAAHAATLQPFVEQPSPTAGGDAYGS